MACWRWNLFNEEMNIDGRLHNFINEYAPSNYFPNLSARHKTLSPDVCLISSDTTNPLPLLLEPSVNTYKEFLSFFLIRSKLLGCHYFSLWDDFCTTSELPFLVKFLVKVSSNHMNGDRMADGDFKSSTSDLCHGSPQGSVLGPPLFSICMSPLGRTKSFQK